jgi:hypothetical protein
VTCFLLLLYTVHLCICTQVYRLGFVREDYRGLSKLLGIYESNSQRMNFRHVTVLHKHGNTYLLYDRRLSPLAPEDVIRPPADLTPVAAPQGTKLNIHIPQ